jgi:hypothetical protein
MLRLGVLCIQLAKLGNIMEREYLPDNLFDLVII